MKMHVTAAVAAIVVAVLASPAPAQNWQAPNWRSANVPVSTDNVFWGWAYAPLQAPPAYGMAYGSAVRVPGGPAPAVAAPQAPRILDCVHVTFPQCGGVGGN